MMMMMSMAGGLGGGGGGGDATLATSLVKMMPGYKDPDEQNHVNHNQHRQPKCVTSKTTDIYLTCVNLTCNSLRWFANMQFAVSVR